MKEITAVAIVENRNICSGEVLSRPITTIATAIQMPKITKVADEYFILFL